MAWLILTGFAVIMAAAVTSELSRDNRISHTYADRLRAAEQADNIKQNIQSDISTLTLATSQETYQSGSTATGTAVRTSDGTHVTGGINNTADKYGTGSSDLKIPCAWSDITISPADFRLICTTVYCEAGTQSIETQIMTALTILNRLDSDGFPDTVREVIYQSEQYSVTQWTGFEKYGWTDSVEQAVTYALEVNEYPEDMFFFRTEHYHEFGHPYTVSDDLYFSTAE